MGWCDEQWDSGKGHVLICMLCTAYGLLCNMGYYRFALE